MDIDKITIQLGGVERPFKISTLGMYRALDAKGVDALSEFEALTAFYDRGKPTEEAKRNPIKILSVIARIIWVGLLTYDEKITLEDVMVMMDLHDMDRLSTIVGSQMTRFMQGQTAGEAKAPVKRGKVNKS